MIKSTVKMPLMRPIPIITKGLPWWKALYIWVISTRTWEVTQDYYLYIEYLGMWAKIPRGFTFDGASIPKIFRPFFSPCGILLLPGLFHDYGYRYGYLLDGSVTNTGKEIKILRYYRRKNFDDLFYRVCIQVNGLNLLMSIPYLAVLIGGGFPWRAYRKNDK